MLALFKMVPIIKLYYVYFFIITLFQSSIFYTHITIINFYIFLKDFCGQLKCIASTHTANRNEEQIKKEWGIKIM